MRRSWTLESVLMLMMIDESKQEQPLVICVSRWLTDVEVIAPRDTRGIFQLDCLFYLL